MNRRTAILSVLIIVLIIFLIVVGTYIYNELRPEPIVESPVEQIDEEPQPLTEEEQLEILDELQTENPSDTPEERQRDIDILEQLMNQ